MCKLCPVRPHRQRATRVPGRARSRRGVPPGAVWELRFVCMIVSATFAGHRHDTTTNSGMPQPRPVPQKKGEPGFVSPRHTGSMREGTHGARTRRDAASHATAQATMPQLRRHNSKSHHHRREAHSQDARKSRERNREHQIPTQARARHGVGRAIDVKRLSGSLKRTQ